MRVAHLTPLLLLGALLLPLAAQQDSAAKAGDKPASQAAKPGTQAKSKDAAAATSKYRPAQVMAAKVHQPAAGEDSQVVRYDVTVYSGNMEYVILYTPPAGTDVVRYQLGRDGLALIEGNTFKWHDMLGRPHQAPILRQRPIPPKTEP